MSGQELRSLTKVNETSSKHSVFWGIDALGHHYYGSPNEIYKHDGEKTYSYQSIGSGTISKVDFSNPLTVMLFFESRNTVILLDRYLNRIREINWDHHSTPMDIKAAGMAAQNQLWIWDQLSNQLSLFHPVHNRLTTIPYLFNNPIQKYDSTLLYFYWTDTDNQLNRVDFYGKHQIITQIPQDHNFKILDFETIAHWKNNELFIYSISTGKTFKCLVDNYSIESIGWENQKLSIFTNSRIINYILELP